MKKKISLILFLLVLTSANSLAHVVPENIKTICENISDRAYVSKIFRNKIEDTFYEIEQVRVLQKKQIEENTTSTTELTHKRTELETQIFVLRKQWKMVIFKYNKEIAIECR